MLQQAGAMPSFTRQYQDLEKQQQKRLEQLQAKIQETPSAKKE